MTLWNAYTWLWVKYFTIGFPSDFTTGVYKIKTLEPLWKPVCRIITFKRLYLTCACAYVNNLYKNDLFPSYSRVSHIIGYRQWKRSDKSLNQRQSVEKRNLTLHLTQTIILIFKLHSLTPIGNKYTVPSRPFLITCHILS